MLLRQSSSHVFAFFLGCENEARFFLNLFLIILPLSRFYPSTSQFNLFTNKIILFHVHQLDGSAFITIQKTINFWATITLSTALHQSTLSSSKREGEAQVILDQPMIHKPRSLERLWSNLFTYYASLVHGMIDERR